CQKSQEQDLLASRRIPTLHLFEVSLPASPIRCPIKRKSQSLIKAADRSAALRSRHKHPPGTQHRHVHIVYIPPPQRLCRNKTQDRHRPLLSQPLFLQGNRSWGSSHSVYKVRLVFYHRSPQEVNQSIRR